MSREADLFALSLKQIQLKWDILAARRESPIARWGDYALPTSERLAKSSVPKEEEEE